MRAELLVGRILDDEGLIGDLGEEAAQELVAWLVGQAERIADSPTSDADARAAVETLCRRGRAIAQQVTQACHTKPGTDELACLQEMLVKESNSPS